MPVRRPVWSGICHCLGEQETWARPFPLLGLGGPICKVKGDGEKLPLFPWLHEVASFIEHGEIADNFLGWLCPALGGLWLPLRVLT